MFSWMKNDDLKLMVCRLMKRYRGWCIKFATGLNTKIGIAQIACIRVIKLSSCQNDYPMGESFW